MKTYKVILEDETTMTGTAEEVMQRLRQEMFDPSICETMQDYLKWLTQNIWRLENVTVTIPDGDLPTQCEGVLEQLIMMKAVRGEQVK